MLIFNILNSTGCGLMQNQNMKRVELKLKETTAPVAWWVPLKK